MAMVRIWQGKKLRLDRLSFPQKLMVEIGSAGVLDVKRRLSQAQGPTDGPAKPLGKGYAIYKSKMRRGNRRNLFLTGDMLRNLSLRTVSENSARAGLTKEKERIKGWNNMKKEIWCVFSPANVAATARKAREVFGRIVRTMVRAA